MVQKAEMMKQLCKQDRDHRATVTPTLDYAHMHTHT